MSNPEPVLGGLDFTRYSACGVNKHVTSSQGERLFAPNANTDEATLHLPTHVLHADHFLTEVAALGPVNRAPLQRSVVGVISRCEVNAKRRNTEP